ncbi:M13 family metallopeptidase [Lacinutrix sp. C3R15]|uniref:M13 family metallopeptidase n=1 Tax=Flavobacteriaceae TaxID=49546 RepID=UPI001C09B71C|nr:MULTISPECIES: M13 family metallopeptidase [Flavobacteriaceae]MBU2938226.1 M13 family metallopeptidase [Lacinutrix sp. C3R15]MDO6621540.1 M13 family metallopeptidase [Oceanihabitans sp. 1_MG-2023]
MNTNFKKLSLLSAVALIGLVSCKEEAKKEIAVVESTPGINLDYIDNSVPASEDFFKHVNGKWLENNEIPDDQSTWGSFQELRKNTDADALAILKSAMSDNKDLDNIQVLPGSDQEKAVFYYQTIMDTVSRNKAGIAPVQPILEKIEAIKNIEDLQAFMIEMEPQGGGGLYGFGVGSDPKDSNRNVAYLGGGSTGLPDRDYYIKDDADSKEKRQKYVAHITRMFQFLGDTEAEAKAQAEQILAFETKLEEAKMDKVDRRDARKRYNPRSIADVQKMVPAVNWKNFLSGIGVKELDTVIIGDLGYFNRLQEVLEEDNVSDWKSYLKWDAFNGAAGFLSTDIETANWEFYGKELNGSKAQRARGERALGSLNRTIGEALGKLYVDKKFPPEAKVKAEKMIKNVILAFENRINKLEWMSPETKQKAIEKLKATKVKIAYPDKWKDYSALEINSVENGGTYLQNALNARAWNFNKDLDKLGKPVDKSEWYMAPQVVNAYFNPAYNEIVFPAAILQPPFYNFTADDAVNYGGIGAVIGHEISHSFDDSGSRYDKDGNLNNWWTDEDLEQFEGLGKALADQYSAIEVLPETNINGAFTLGENIGDLGGVLAAYDALQMSFEGNKPAPIDGYTAEQRFFMSWATVWRTKMRDDALRTKIKTDPHSPGMNRAVQPLLNVDAFYEAFDIKEGDKMYIAPEERVRIW